MGFILGCKYAGYACRVIDMFLCGINFQLSDVSLKNALSIAKL